MNSINKILAKGSDGIRVFIDLNETLIRTGEVTFTDRLIEINELEEFTQLCRFLSKNVSIFEVVFITGNSFEYSRRIEEPLGLKNFENISLIIVSENGLIGRSFQQGDLWKASTNQEYDSAIKKILSLLNQHEQTKGRYYTQGNEVRLTIKPILNEFIPNEINVFEEIASITEIKRACKIYIHKYYFDVDPAKVYIDGEEILFNGKKYAVNRLARSSKMFNMGIGDSLSDIPMFDAIIATRGKVFWVANSSKSLLNNSVERLTLSYSGGVNEMLKKIIVI
jgi:hydroxymethylpyrimidine pyrophosphatase-like HAD family hydrolase